MRCIGTPGEHTVQRSLIYRVSRGWNDQSARQYRTAALLPATWEYHNSSAFLLQVGGLEKQPNCENTHLSCRYVYLAGKERGLRRDGEIYR